MDGQFSQPVQRHWFLIFSAINTLPLATRVNAFGLSLVVLSSHAIQLE